MKDYNEYNLYNSYYKANEIKNDDNYIYNKPLIEEKEFLKYGIDNFNIEFIDIEDKINDILNKKDSIYNSILYKKNILNTFKEHEVIHNLNHEIHTFKNELTDIDDEIQTLNDMKSKIIKEKEQYKNRILDIDNLLHNKFIYPVLGNMIKGKIYFK